MYRLDIIIVESYKCIDTVIHIDQDSSVVILNNFVKRLEIIIIISRKTNLIHQKSNNIFIFFKKHCGKIYFS